MDGVRAINSTETVDGGRAIHSIETVDGGRAMNSTETVDGGRARNSTETVDGGRTRNSTETVDGGRARNSTGWWQGQKQHSSSYRVCSGAHPSYSSTLHFCDVVFAWYLPEMWAARHDMVQIARGCAAHTVFFLTVAPQMFRCRGGSLSRAHSVGRPPCTPRQCVTTRQLFFWMDVIS